MTSPARRSTAYGGLLFLGIVLVVTLLVLMAHIGRALAQPTGASEDDPVSLVLRLYAFMRTGEGTMAVGVVNLLLVWCLRHVLSKKIAWFGTMVGGYVLGFVTAAGEYAGVSLTSGSGLSLTLLANTIGAAWVASGGWEALRDLMTKTKKPVVSVVTLVAILGTLVLSTASGCRPGGPGPVVAQAAIDCVSADRERIDAALGEFMPLVSGGRVSWPNVYQRAKVLGGSVGACFLGELVNAYLGGRRAPETDDGWEARLTFEKFRREEVNNATLKTRAGEL